MKNVEVGKLSIYFFGISGIPAKVNDGFDQLSLKFLEQLRLAGNSLNFQ